MGCFLACFGTSKDAKRHHQRHRILPRDQRCETYSHVQVSIVSSNQEKIELPITPVSQIKCRDTQPIEQTSSGKRKKVVTFDSNIKTYEPVSTNETKDHELDIVENCDEKKEVLAKLSKVTSNSEDGSINSSLGSSFPPNHRYQNCRESDDEIEESDCDDEYDLDDDEELDDDDDEYNDVYSEDDDDHQRRSSEEQLCGSLSSMESRTRDRSGLLNPVENLSQWKILKTRGTSPFKLQKENSNPELIRSPNQEIAVDASLSNWLISSESAAKSKNNSHNFTCFTPEKGNSPIYLEDRPILGALTIEEINKFSTPSSSPRKSPNRNPDDMPIIGSVGSYWSRDSDKDSGSISSSYKGIPNTTSKYREDKRINWHSTPFETRLEKALNRHGCAEA